ncbi:MAG: RlmE family RNA methyltransferase [Beijerinckiaceae bacterium]
MAVRLKTAHKRTLSQQKWLERQLNDPFVARAKAEGFRSRAAFKLQEIDDKYKLLKPGQRIVDLGAAPGGWAQIAARKTGSDKLPDASKMPDSNGEPDGDDAPAAPADAPVKRAGASRNRGVVVGIDLLAIEPIPGVDFIQLDFTLDEAPGILKTMLGGKADGVLSDMAANTTGHKQTDHLRIIGLTEMAVEFASEVLKPGGFFLTKLFQGGETGTLIAQLKRDFAKVLHVKPAASRADSSELYVLATGFRGNKNNDA